MRGSEILLEVRRTAWYLIIAWPCQRGEVYDLVSRWGISRFIIDLMLGSVVLRKIRATEGGPASLFSCLCRQSVGKLNRVSSLSLSLFKMWFDGWSMNRSIQSTEWRKTVQHVNGKEKDTTIVLLMLFGQLTPHWVLTSLDITDTGSSLSYVFSSSFKEDSHCPDLTD